MVGRLRDWVAGVPRTTKHRTLAPAGFGAKGAPKKEDKKRTSKI